MAKDLGFRQSPNHTNGRRGWDNKADIIVLHVTEGGFNGAVDWLCNPVAEASSHFVTANNGSYKQLVELKDTAWCNGNGPTSFHEATNATVKSREPANANNYTFSIENEGYSYKGNFGIPTSEQMGAIYEVCHKIVDFILTYKPTWRASRENIIGHCHIRKNSKPSCPSPNYGEKFPFDVIVNNINEYIDRKLGVTSPSIPVVTPTTPKPIDTVAAAGIQVGTMVRVNRGAKTYTGGGIASFVYDNIYPVSSYSGERVVLDKTGICTPFNVRDLTVVTGGIEKVEELKVGSYVKIQPGAVWLTNPPASIPGWVINSTHVIDELDGNRAVLDSKGICSPIDIKYLLRV